jgi:hypothetical protein
MDDLIEFARSIYANVHAATAAHKVSSIGKVLTSTMRQYLEGDPDDHCWGIPIQRIDQVSIVGVNRGALDVVTVRILATTESGQVLEDWTFERPGSAKPDVTECMFCGAPKSLDERGNCTYCRTHLLGVAGDWRLSRATQPSATVTHPAVVRALQTRWGQALLYLFLLFGLAATIGMLVAIFRYM